MSTKIQLFHSQVSGNVPPDGLLVGEIAFNVADNFQFIGYGGDVNYDVFGNALDILPPPGKGWRTFVTGGGDQPGPPGPGVPVGGQTGQVLSKLSNGDYVTGWVDTFGPATPTTVGVVYGLTTTAFGGNSSVALGFQAHANIGTGIRNVGIGYQAGLNQNNVSDNVVIGHQAAWNIDGSENVVIGSEALGNNPGGAATGNVAVGYKAGYNLTEGDGNIFIGYESGDGVRTGAANVIIGRYPGGSDWIGNVALADGYGELKFLANQSGAWSTDGEDFGAPDFVLTSQGDGLPPIWKEIPLGFVSKIVAGNNITIDPQSGTGVVTINATNGGGGGVTSIGAGNGLNVSSGGANPIVNQGTLEVDFTKVLGTALITGKGSLIVGSSVGSAYSLPVGTTGQFLQAQSDGSLTWVTVPSQSPATPTTLGLVYGYTGPTNSNAYLGQGAGVGVTTGTGNTFLGATSGVSITTGSNNTIVGSADGSPTLQNNVILSDGSGNVRMQINSSGAWSAAGGAYGLAGQVLSSLGESSPPLWINPPNAPIQTINDGPGISVTTAGTAVTISNEGLLSATGSSPIQVTTSNGVASISAPNVLSDLQNGLGISITGSGNSRTVANTGVVTLQNGTNTTVESVGGGVWKVNSTGGGGGGTITSLQEGAGINITNPTGPSPTIINSGVVSIQSSANVIPSSNTGTVTLSLQNVVFGVTAGSGITVGGTATNPTIANSGVIQLVNGTGTTAVNNNNGTWQINATGTAGVTKLLAGNNISLSPTSGVGEVTITAAGGGGGGSITEIRQGTGITVNSGTGPITTITNNGVLALQAGSNVTIGGTANNPIINAAGSLNNLTAGKGISITNATGPNATITNSGVVGLEAGGGVTITETGAGTGVFNISASGGGGTVLSVTGQGAGISVTPNTGAVVVQNTGVTSITGTAGNITATTATGGVTLNIGANVLTNITAGTGITVGGTGNTRSITAAVANVTAGAGINVTPTAGVFNIVNTGVLGLTQGANVTITETTPGSGNYTISSTGGGGGGGVTSITAGLGLTGGTITASGTIAVNTSVVPVYSAFDSGQGKILYGDSTGHSFTTAIPKDNTYIGKYYLRGYYGVGDATYVEWAKMPVNSFFDSDSTVFNQVDAIFNTGIYQANVRASWVQENAIAWGSAAGAHNGAMIYAQQSAPLATYQTKILEAGTPGQFLMMGTSGILNVPTPVWTNLPATGVTGVTGTAPIQVNNTNPLTPIVGFDVNTTTLTQYVPKSSFTLAGQLLYGTGSGTYGALNIGNNGQFLSVNNTGSLEWADVVIPPAGVTTLTKGTGIIFTVNGSPSNTITSEGTISIDPTAVLTPTSLGTLMGARGSLLTTSPDNTLSRLAPPSSGTGQVLSFNGSLPFWGNTIDAGTY